MRDTEFFSASWTKANVASVLETQLLQQFSLALITTLDSSNELATTKIGREVVERYSECRILGHGIVIPSGLLGRANHEMGLFYGFDEVWFFDSQPFASKPDNVSLVAPLNLSVEPLPPQIANWMTISHCLLGIGDGFGLNYVTADAKVAELLRQSVRG